MAIEATDIRTILISAMRIKVAECVINGDDNELGKANIAVAVVAKLTDEQIEEKLRELFAEAVERTNFVLEF